MQVEFDSQSELDPPSSLRITHCKPYSMTVTDSIRSMGRLWNTGSDADLLSTHHGVEICLSHKQKRMHVLPESALWKHRVAGAVFLLRKFVFSTAF
jgi:hypothetical protein